MLWVCAPNASGPVSLGIGHGSHPPHPLHWPYPWPVAMWLPPLRIQTTSLGIAGFLSFSGRVSAVSCLRSLLLPIPLRHRFQSAEVALVSAALILGHCTVLEVRRERRGRCVLFLVVPSVWHC